MMASVHLEWRTREPAAVKALVGAERLPSLPLAVTHDANASADRLELVGTLASLLRSLRTTSPGHALQAVGWATVDHERLADELGIELCAEAATDPFLGADGWRGRGPAEALVLLEPAIEGPLAAALARHGEGPMALYVLGLGDPEDPARTVPTALGVPGVTRSRGRFGPWLVLLTSAPGARTPRADAGHRRRAAG